MFRTTRKLEQIFVSESGLGSQEELSKYMAMEVWAAVKEHSMKALRNMKTEIEQLEGALRQIAKQHQQLKEKVVYHFSN